MTFKMKITKKWLAEVGLYFKCRGNEAIFKVTDVDQDSWITIAYDELWDDILDKKTKVDYTIEHATIVDIHRWLQLEHWSNGIQAGRYYVVNQRYASPLLEKYKL